MRNASNLPEFTPAGRANILMHVARLSGGAYIEPPIDASNGAKLRAFLWGGAICSAVTALVMVL